MPQLLRYLMYCPTNGFWTSVCSWIISHIITQSLCLWFATLMNHYNQMLAWPYESYRFIQQLSCRSASVPLLIANSHAHHTVQSSLVTRLKAATVCHTSLTNPCDSNLLTVLWVIPAQVICINFNMTFLTRIEMVPNWSKDYDSGTRCHFTDNLPVHLIRTFRCEWAFCLTSHVACNQQRKSNALLFLPNISEFHFCTERC